MAYYVCSGAKMKYLIGSQGADLYVMHPVDPARVEGNPIAAMQDYKPMLNIKPFGQCRSLANPVVAAATAEKYGLATWKCFYGDECGDGEGGVEHKKVMKKINSTYGDELLKEKGGVPHDYRSSLCYHYPWVPFSLTINRGEEEKTDKKDEDKEVRYKIYDGERDALIAEGTVVDDKIEDLFPDVEYPVIFVDDMRIWLNPVQQEMPFGVADEEDDEKRIVDAYWCYGDDQQRLTTDDSRHYVDLSLYIITENYNDGDTVSVNLKIGDTNPEPLLVSGTVYDNKAVIENIFKDDLVL